MRSPVIIKRLSLLLLSTLVLLSACRDKENPLVSDDPDGDPDTIPTPPPGSVLAFPGAEGFGANATGGRHGAVIKVNTLAASGPGSLQEALDETGPRIIVFDVSGVIEADIIRVNNGDVTIAGQTAPGAGITIEGRFYGAYDYDVDNIIVRHLRIRPPEYIGSDGNQYDGMQFSRNSLMIFDHICVSFGVDETIDLYEAQDVTLQWSTITESATEGHPEGEHNYGLINGPSGRRLSVHHNLFAHNKNRNPAIANGPADVVNNVVYNVRHGFIHHNPASGPFNIIGNYYRQGPDNSLIPFYFDDENGGQAADLAYYLFNNYIDDPGDYVGRVDNPWAQPYLHPSFASLFLDESYRSLTKFIFETDYLDYIPITTGEPQTAYEEVLLKAGAWPRDVVTLTVVDETEARTGEWGARIPPDLLAGLTAGQPPADLDNDGMADAWENANGLNPSDGTDHSTIMPSGYSAIEEYINSLAELRLTAVL